jgi:hypothetical protein
MINQFISDNHIDTLKKDPTQNMHKQIQSGLKACKTLIDKHKRTSLLQMNPKAPTLKARVKIHKPTAPIRLVINNINALAYKLAAYMQHKLKELVHLKNEYNYKNTTMFVADISKFHIENSDKFLTLDIKDLYINIPI